MTAAAKDRPTLTLVLRPEPGVDSIRALRALLKVTLRQSGLRCICIVEDHRENENAKSASAGDR